jgi:GT2 family glycosyltransferase
VIPAVIIPVLNRFDLLEECISSIDCEVEHLLIVDNSGQYSMPAGLYGGKATVLNMPANMGVAGSWNLGIKSFPFAPYWIITSNDIRYAPGQLRKLADNSSPDVLIKTSQEWSSFSIGINIVKKVGLFDENYHPAYYEDTDYESRMRRLGLGDSCQSKNINVIAYGAATTIQTEERLFNRNIVTNESNYQYWQKKFNADGVVDAGQYDLQRRIDNDLFS